MLNNCFDCPVYQFCESDECHCRTCNETVDKWLKGKTEKDIHDLYDKLIKGDINNEN